MTPLPIAFQITIFCWFAFEIGLLVRDIVRGRISLGRDRGTRAMVSLSLVGAIALGLTAGTWFPWGSTPAPTAFATAGIVVLWIGLVIRIWAVLALGRAFSTFVQVDAGQKVVTRGPYRWVRHPSYTGLWLIALGFGVGGHNWLAIVVCATVPLLGLRPRIAVEEAELIRSLGDAYRAYQRTTARLIPGLW